MDSARPPPACAECLFNPDLLAEILAHLTSDADTPFARRALLNTALSTQAFYEPAMRILWRHIDGLIPLLRLLPTFTFAHTDLGPVEPEHWAHFDRRAACVREIHYHPAPPLARAVRTRLARHRSPLLPNLVRVRCTAHTPVPAELALLVSLTLADVEWASYSHGVGARDKYFAALTAQGVSLRRLALVRMHGAPSADFLRALVHLEDLEIWCFGEAVSEDRRQLLPALRRLRILESPPERLLAFLRSVASDNLQSIAILDEGWDSVDVVDAPSQRAVCELIAARWAPTLRSLELHTHLIDDVDSLQCCTQLTALSLHCATFPAARLLALTRAWPALTALTAPAAHGVDLAALAQLAAQLPRLTLLDADLALTNILPPLPTTPALAHGLQRLVLHSLPPAAHDKPLLACHLVRLFPRLDSIRSAGRVYGDAWSGVLDCVFGDAEGAGKHAYESALSPTVWHFQFQDPNVVWDMTF
ncbi:hypothetical protein B0H10DRAFT_2196717 [Mycena sp. CBHHK59/15]|nr:hypothetical protein B0H10DRAFT_2196717 [Mycena sp. CBHHK59/15]